MIPDGVEVVLDEFARWICTSDDVGLDVAIKDGKSAMCCSLMFVGGVDVDVDRRGGVSESDAAEGDGDGGRETVVRDETFPFDLPREYYTPDVYMRLCDTPICPEPKHHLPIHPVIPHTPSDFCPSRLVCRSVMLSQSPSM